MQNFVTEKKWIKKLLKSTEDKSELEFSWERLHELAVKKHSFNNVLIREGKKITSRCEDKENIWDKAK